MPRFLSAICVLLLGLSAIAQADHHLETIHLEGIWHAQAETDGGARRIRWTFAKKGEKIQGESEDLESGDARKLDRVKVKEQNVTLEVDVEQDGNAGIIIVEAEQKAPGKLSGRWSVEDDEGNEFMSGAISAWKEIAFEGEWEAVAELADGNAMNSVVKLKGKNEQLAGSIDGDHGVIELDKAQAKEQTVRFEFDFDINGSHIDAVVEAEAHGEDALVGKWIVPNYEGNEMSGKWTAKRKKPTVAGNWNVTAVIPGGEEYEGAIALTAKDGKYSGTSTSNAGETSTMKTATFDGKALEFATPFDRDGYVGTIRVEAKLQKDGSLKGEWSFVDESGQEVARDAWRATRK